MSFPHEIERRHFLKAALGLGSAAVVAKLAPWRVLVEINDAPVSARLVGLLEHRRSARLVGRAYLQEASGKHRESTLVDAIAGGIDGGPKRVHQASEGELRELLAELVRSDFAAERVVKVNGWILSRTEASLYGLAAVHDRGAGGRGGRRHS